MWKILSGFKDEYRWVVSTSSIFLSYILVATTMEPGLTTFWIIIKNSLTQRFNRKSLRELQYHKRPTIIVARWLTFIDKIIQNSLISHIFLGPYSQTNLTIWTYNLLEIKLHSPYHNQNRLDTATFIASNQG